MRNAESAQARPKHSPPSTPSARVPQAAAGGHRRAVSLDQPDTSGPQWTQSAAFQDRAFVYQSAWLARALATSRPARHVDISASACFAAIASAFLHVDFYEFDRLTLNLPNLRTGILDFDPLPFRDASLESVSSAGIIEWLGSKGAPPGEDLSALRELARVVAPDGSLLIPLPVGQPRPAGELKRVYSFGQVLDAFEGFELEEFILISDGIAGQGPLMNPDPSLVERQKYGMGCFWLRKSAPRKADR